MNDILNNYLNSSSQIDEQNVRVYLDTHKETNEAVKTSPILKKFWSLATNVEARVSEVSVWHVLKFNIFFII